MTHAHASYRIQFCFSSNRSDTKVPFYIGYQMDPIINYLQARVNTCLVETNRLYQEIATVSRLLASLQASVNQSRLADIRRNAYEPPSSTRLGDYLSRGEPIALEETVQQDTVSPISERHPLRTKISSLGRKN